MQAYVIDKNSPEKLVRREVADPQPLPGELVVRVAATSLNRGEVFYALEAGVFPDGYIVGWDLAGVVERAASNGQGPKVGERVAAFVENGAWAELVAVPVENVAVIPDGLSFTKAATLPVAGLTALHAIYKGGPMLKKNVLVTGATGGVGDYAIQLAVLSGAQVTAYIRRESQREFIQKTGAHHIAVGDTLAQAAGSLAPFDLIIESVGGKVLGDALAMLAESGTCVLFGVSGGTEVTFEADKFFGVGGVQLYGMTMPKQLKWVESAGTGLSKLSALVQNDQLKPQISVEESWDKLPQLCRDLLDRKFQGKAVLHIGA